MGGQFLCLSTPAAAEMRISTVLVGLRFRTSTIGWGFCIPYFLARAPAVVVVVCVAKRRELCLHLCWGEATRETLFLARLSVPGAVGVRLGCDVCFCPRLIYPTSAVRRICPRRALLRGLEFIGLILLILFLLLDCSSDSKASFRDTARATTRRSLRLRETMEAVVFLDLDFWWVGGGRRCGKSQRAGWEARLMRWVCGSVDELGGFLLTKSGSTQKPGPNI